MWRRGRCGRLIAAALVVAGCGAGRPSTNAQVSVTPSTSLADQAVHLRITGLTPGQRITLRVRATDSTGVPWASAQRYVANGAGSVSVDGARARSGAYSGVWGMGPIAMMRPLDHSRSGFFYWADRSLFLFTATVQSHGRAIGQTTFSRRFLPADSAGTITTLQQQGFIANFIYPRHARHRAAVLVLGGSEGGVPSALQSSALVAKGYPVLALAYFGAPGLPNSLTDIPLEYFARALHWLADQPQVDRRRIAVLGVSRGSEAAQLLGVHYPKLVHAVIALVPSDVALCSYPGCGNAAWTLHGKPIPYTTQLDQPHPRGQTDAEIPDQRIHGPIFLACGGQDREWSSCPYAAAIQQRLDAAHFGGEHPLYRYPKAGHDVGTIQPYEPTTPTGVLRLGGSALANQRAIAADWPRLVTFLAAFSHQR